MAPPDLAAALSDETPVTVSITSPTWTRETITVTVDTVRSDRRLWRQMHLGDWDTVATPLRERALTTMLVGYAHVLRRADWDVRGADEIMVELDVEDAAATDVRQSTRQASRDFSRRYFVQMKGTATISGRIRGTPLTGTGAGFFETYR